MSQDLEDTNLCQRLLRRRRRRRRKKRNEVGYNCDLLKNNILNSKTTPTITPQLIQQWLEIWELNVQGSRSQ
jgi:hypothetical protein